MSRAADLIIAGLGLIVASPILLAAAVAIRIGSRGPVIYRQRRVGQHGEIFELWKLRTMKRGADPIGVGTAVIDDDPRVTRAGRLLRRFSLDSSRTSSTSSGRWRSSALAQPSRLKVELYTPRQRRRLELKPG